MSIEDKMQALADFREVSLCDIKQGYSDVVFEVGEFDCCGGEEYVVLTDQEADEQVREYIMDSLWAFNSDFIMQYLNVIPTGLAYDKLEEGIKSAQVDLCESANDLILGLISNNIESFIDGAVSADGRGHFISHYDGEENEEGDFFIYRIN